MMQNFWDSHILLAAGSKVGYPKYLQWHFLPMPMCGSLNPIPNNSPDSIDVIFSFTSHIVWHLNLGVFVR